MASASPQISPTATRKRETARHSDGKFGTQPRPDAPQAPSRKISEESSSPETAIATVAGQEVSFVRSQLGWGHSFEIAHLTADDEGIAVSELCDAVTAGLNNEWLSPDQLDHALVCAYAGREASAGRERQMAALGPCDADKDGWVSILSAVAGELTAPDGRCDNALLRIGKCRGMKLLAEGDIQAVPQWFWRGLLDLASQFDERRAAAYASGYTDPKIYNNPDIAKDRATQAGMQIWQTIESLAQGKQWNEAEAKEKRPT